MGFFVKGEVSGLDHAFAGARVGFAFLLGQLRHNLVHGDIHRGVVFCLPADDQRRTGLVNQNGVHLIDDGEVQPALHPVCSFVDHVVAQVVKAIFVVGAVGDVAAVGCLLFFARHVRQIDADTQAQKVVQLAHPLRISAGQVIIDRHHVNALACQRIQVHRQCGRQRFSFTRAHL